MFGVVVVVVGMGVVVAGVVLWIMVELKGALELLGPVVCTVVVGVPYHQVLVK